ncbi:MAG: 16S rRNA (uracil(1498)-N(3))-methyltransferase [Candidatus Buchananbacteria bacterium]
MTQPRFIGSFDLMASEIVINDPALIKQLLKVFRFKINDQFILGNGQNQERLVLISQIKPEQIIVKTLAEIKTLPIAKNQVVLFCAVLKKENFEWVVQKATEVGVTTIQPILTERTVKQNLSLSRLQKIAQEATEQSGRGQAPVIKSILSLKSALETVAVNDTAIIFDAAGKPVFEPWRALQLGQLAPKNQARGQFKIFVGPEGGFSPQELELAQKQGLIVYNLGLFTLRAETAAVVSSYLIVNF